MVLDYIFYSSLTLAIMSAIAATLAIIFNFKKRSLNQLPTNLTPDIYNKTYSVFNPYPDEKKTIHRFIIAVPLLVFFATFVLFLIQWEILKSGLILSFFITIIGLNLILVEEAPEIYKNSKIFHKAIQSKAELAPGDLKTLQLIKKATKKLGDYYFALTTFFIFMAAILPYIITSVIQSIVMTLESMVQASGWASILGWQVTMFTLATSYVTLLAVTSQIKSKIFKYKQ